MSLAPRSPRKGEGGFSLIELLVVMGIIVVMIGLAASSLTPDNSGKNLAVNGQQVARCFDQARQLATTYNQYVQVRLYTPEGESGVTRIGIFLSESPYYGSAAEYSGWLAAGLFRPEGKDLVINSGIVMASGPQASKLLSLLKNDTEKTRTGTAKVGGNNYEFVSFYYRPDGTPDFQWLGGSELSPDDAYISLVQGARYEATKPSLPDNYFTLVFVPSTGRTVTRRP